jgi:hypothetical protein
MTHSKGVAYHGTPCQIVLADVDRNGKSEIIVALGGYYDYTNLNVNNFKWSKRLVCYEVNDNTFSMEYLPTQTPATTSAENLARLTLKWVSDKRYDYNSNAVVTPNTPGNNLNSVPAYTFSDSEAGGPGKGFTDGGGYCYSNSTYSATGGGTASLYYFCSPLPQIVDLNGNGKLGILVYNKVYDAANGKLLVELENLNPANTTAVYMESNYVTASQYAFTGRDVNAKKDGGGNGGDTNCGFSCIYDANKDGKMDIACGGKLYYNIDWENPNLLTGNLYSVLKDVPGNGLYSSTAAQDYVGDGHTAVADINDDGIEEIIVLHRKPGDSGISGTILITAWNPGFFTVVNGQVTPVAGPPVPVVVAQAAIPVSGLGFGNHSPLVIGDLDKLLQTDASGRQHKVPEISFLSGNMYSTYTDISTFVHPNVRTALATKLERSGSTQNYRISNSGAGQICSFSYDFSEPDVTQKLKLSFVIQHGDDSNNTTFTLFDFDNNGTQDICYRDNSYLRIMSPASPYYIALDDVPTVGDSKYNPMIKFRTSIKSHTGFECPAIADVDGDGSADMIVMGGTSAHYNTSMYCVEAYNTEFAPAPPVWNQFNYNGLRIMEDLKLPTVQFDPLNPEFHYILDKTNPTDSTWVYNCTMTQVPVYALFKVLNPTVPPGSLTGTAADSIICMSPILKEPDVKVWAKTIALTTTTGKIQIWITNTGSAALNGSYPVVIYETAPGAISSISSATKRDVFPVGQSVFPGDTVFMEYTIRTTAPSNFSSTSPNLDYIVRVSDANYAEYQISSAGTFQPNGKQWRDDTYLECNWADNWAYTSAFRVADDIFTLQPYEHLNFNVLDNDERPSTCSSILPVFGQTDDDIRNGGAGTRVTTAAGDVHYMAPPTYPNGVVDMSYQLTCGSVTKTGNILIYILENLTGEYAVCRNTSISVGAKEQPTGTTFQWLDDSGRLLPNTGPGTFLLTKDTTFYVTPHPPAPYDEIAFPEDTVRVYAIGAGNGSYETLRWAGGENDGSWNNPGNWKIWNNSDWVSVPYSPNACTDVLLPSVSVGGSYPKADKPGAAAKIIMENRAMIANTHLIDYDSAAVTVNFEAAERNRWVMYSSPLRKTYSGDFMLRDASEVPLLPQINPSVSDPAVYMSLFQTAYPDNTSITAQARAFTQPFGKASVPLPLGRAFNLWIDADVDTDTPFRFPSPLNKYDYWVHTPNGTPGEPESTDELLRTDGADNTSGNRINGRFIVEDAVSTNPVSGEFSITLPDDQPGFTYLMAPNPFMAYLDMLNFLNTNTASLHCRYKVWDGANGSFISYQPMPLYRPGPPYSGGTWWLASAPANWVTPTVSDRGYVAPLQGFIVEKKTSASTPALIYIPELMTSVTCSPSSYELRNAKDEDSPEGVLYIVVSHNEVKNSTVLVNVPDAFNSYNANEDVSKLTCDSEGKPQLSVYTITPEGEALDINLSGDFDGVEIPIGLRTNISGEITFEFPGAAGFGRKVYLLDGDTETDLSATPAYTTVIAGNGNDLSRFYEINNRFALKFPRRGESIGENPKSRIRVQGTAGKILVSSSDPMLSVEVIASTGCRIYKSDASAYFQAIDISAPQVCMVRIMTDKGIEMHKVVVK